MEIKDFLPGNDEYMQIIDIIKPQVIHVHGNNCCGFNVIKGILFLHF